MLSQLIAKIREKFDRGKIDHRNSAQEYELMIQELQSEIKKLKMEYGFSKQQLNN